MVSYTPKTGKSKLKLLLGIGVIVFGLPFFVSATERSFKMEDSVFSIELANSSPYLTQGIGKNLSGIPEYAKVHIQASTTSGYSLRAILEECGTGSSWTTACGEVETSAWIPYSSFYGASTEITFTFSSTTIQLNPNYYYFLSFVPSYAGLGNIGFSGYSTDEFDEYENTKCLWYGSGNYYDCSGVSDIYFDFKTDSFDEYDFASTTDFIRIDDPSNGTSTNSRTINISIDAHITQATSTNDFNYLYMDFFPLSYSNDEYQRFIYSSPIPRDIDFNISGQITLNRDGYYLAIAYLSDGESEVYLADSVRFNSATTTIIPDFPLLDFGTDACDEFTGIIDNSLCNTLMFLFYPSADIGQDLLKNLALFKERFPFSVFYDLKETFENLSTTVSTPSAITYTPKGFNNENLYSGTSITIFSTSTYATSTLATTMRSYAGTFLYGVFGLYLFFRIKNVL